MFSTVLFLGALLMLGLVSTRAIKPLKLPNVTGYLIVGLLAAIACIFIDKNTATNLEESLGKLNSIVSMIALGFIALSIGQEFKLSRIKALGSKIVTITFFQALAAAVLVDVSLIFVCLLLKVDLAIAIVLGAIATATAPAATLMVIHQYKAQGPLVDILLPVVAFDDAIGLVVFSISIAIAKVISSGVAITFTSICVIPLIEILGSIVLGGLMGIFMHFFIKFFKSRNNHVITIISFTLLAVGFCSALSLIRIDGENLEFSNLLCCMMVGAVYINIAKDREKEIVTRDFDIIDHWTPFLFMLFFVLSGSHLATSAKSIIESSSTETILPIVIIFVIYIIMRSAGKYFGSFFACKITHQDKNITNYLGITLLPQAGVAIGMANTISGMEAFSKNNIGNIIVTVVLCATLLYELVGPLLTKWALVKTNEISKENL